MTAYLFNIKILNVFGIEGRGLFSFANNFVAPGLFSLQIFHHYEIQFSFKDSLGEDLSSDPLQNLHVKVMDVKPTEDGT